MFLYNIIKFNTNLGRIYFYFSGVLGGVMSRGEVQSISTLNDWARYVDKINRQDWG